MCNLYTLQETPGKNTPIIFKESEKNLQKLGKENKQCLLK